MAIELGDDRLKIKQVAQGQGVGIIGNRDSGGLVDIAGNKYWLRHSSWRYNGTDWGRDNSGYTKADIDESGYMLESPPPEESAAAAREALGYFREGAVPPVMTTGVEVEGVLYDKDYQRLISVYGNGVNRPEDDEHPELHEFTVETATRRLSDGNYPRTLVEVARRPAEAVLRGYEIADHAGGNLVYSSVPEGGQFHDAVINRHPYLQLAAPRVRDLTLVNADQIPPEVLALYGQHVPDILQHLQDTGLNWPAHSVHVHNGAPRHGELVDPRIAYVMGQVRQTELAKALSLMLYNTRHLYSQETELLDARSVLRRLLSTTHGAETLPSSAQDYIQKTIAALEKGEIHSASRYPASAQHDRVRLRMEGQYRSVESIDGAMSPDLRAVLAWVMGQKLMDVLALEAMVVAQGDESKAITNLQLRYGSAGAVLKTLSTMGAVSSYSYDMAFNHYGYFGSPNKGKTLTQSMRQVQDIVRVLGIRYPGIRLNALIVSDMIDQQLAPEEDIGIDRYLGVERGIYRSSRNNKGIITRKKGRLDRELLRIQSQATRLQAQFLARVNSEEDISYFLRGRSR